METCSCLGHSSWRLESFVQVQFSTCTDMYATAQYAVHIRKDIQDVLCFAVLNVSSRRGHRQALECLVVDTWSIKSK